MNDYEFDDTIDYRSDFIDEIENEEEEVIECCSHGCNKCLMTETPFWR